MPPKQKHHVGFTGTREGLTQAQADALAGLLEGRQAGEAGGWTLHHGCCRGADAVAHVTAFRLGWRLIGHPASDTTWRADGLAGFWALRQPAPYLVRNRYLVDETVELMACPVGPEKMHSGTWATIRYGRRHRRQVTIIWPDGTLQFAP